MLRRKGTLSPTSSGVGILPTNSGRSLQVDGKGRISKSTLSKVTLQSIVSHVMVAIVVFIFATSSPDTHIQTEILNTASAYLPHYCPTSLLEFLNWYGNRLPEERRHARLKRVQPSTRPSRMTPVPAQYHKTFYYDGSKLSQPVARALRSRGWQQVDSKKNAHIIYTYSNNADWAATLKPWQRFNYIPGYRKWNKKDDFAYYYKLWEAEHKDRPRSVYVPETYLLTDSKEEILAFAKVLKEGGSKYPWVHKQANVNQGKVSMRKTNVFDQRTCGEAASCGK
jgi:hypothetical protein